MEYRPMVFGHSQLGHPPCALVALFQEQTLRPITPLEQTCVVDLPYVDHKVERRTVDVYVKQPSSLRPF